ncbi:MAG: orotate phosphoribosyltransferase [Gammaproteobacteria bacterium]
MSMTISYEFGRFLSETSAVRFGNFRLKSGRETDVFFNLGEIATGRELIELGGYFADYLAAKRLHTCDVIFGPAYKGMNIAIATCIALHQRHGITMPFAYNRKAEKTHAEGGSFVGFDLARAKSALVLDDVITDGGTKYETIEMLSKFPHLKITAFVVGVDRQETDTSGQAVREIFEKAAGIEVLALTTKDQVLTFRK